MSQQRIFGIVLLVAGIVSLIVGLNASHSTADRLSNTFTGHFTDATTWYIIGGAAAGVTGLLLLLVGRSGKNI